MLKKDNNKLLNPASAMASYFDQLLKEEQEETVETKRVNLNRKLLVTPDLEAELSQIERQQIQDNMAIPVKDSERPEKNQSTALGKACEQPRYSDRIDFPLQCLMFYVQENLISIPLVDLLSVVSKVKNLTRLPQAPEWFLGLLQHRDKNIKIADSSRLLSINYQQDDITNYHILVLNNANWGITCNHLGEIIQVDEEDVKWSKPGSGGLSLGIIKQNLAILLDPEKILYRLNNESKQAISTFINTN